VISNVASDRIYFMNPKYFVCLVVLLGVFGIQSTCRAENANYKAATEKFEIFNFEEVKKPDPNHIIPRKWNWEIKLSPSQSQRRFRIVQHTAAKRGSGSDTDKVLFTEKDLQKSEGDIIHFRLHTGDENPAVDMNKKGNIGLGVSFARVGGGYGASNWIVMPGRILKSQLGKYDYLENGELLLVSFETIDSAGNEYRTQLKLEESK